MRVPFLTWIPQGESESHNVMGVGLRLAKIFNVIDKALLGSDIKMIYSESFRCNSKELQLRQAHLADSNQWAQQLSKDSASFIKGAQAQLEEPLFSGVTSAVKEFIYLSQDLFASFVPTHEVSSVHDIRARYWGAVDAICRVRNAPTLIA